MTKTIRETFFILWVNLSVVRKYIIFAKVDQIWVKEEIHQFIVCQPTKQEKQNCIRHEIEIYYAGQYDFPLMEVFFLYNGF